MLEYIEDLAVISFRMQRDGGNDHKEPTESWAQNLLLKSNKGDFEGMKPPLGDTHVPIQIIHSFMQKAVRPEKVRG